MQGSFCITGSIELLSMNKYWQLFNSWSGWKLIENIASLVIKYYCWLYSIYSLWCKHISTGAMCFIPTVFILVVLVSFFTA